MIALWCRHRLAALIVFAGTAVSLVAQAPPPSYDLVIRGGRVLDGMGNPWIAADVAIKDGRFAAVGRLEGRGTQEIDARGRYVSPGWIDMMDQSGGVLPKNGLAENKLRMGVTTAIGGEGGTPVPAEPSTGWRRAASASTSAATTARRKPAPPCSATPPASPRPTRPLDHLLEGTRAARTAQSA